MFIKDINFFDRYYEVQKREKNISKQTTLQISIVAGMLVLTFGLFTTFTVTNASIQGEINTINNYINSPDVQQKLADLTEKEKVLTNATNYYNGIAAATQKIKTQIKPDQALFDGIVNLAPTGLVIESFSFSGGTIGIQCKADQNEKIAQYVNRLRKQKNIFGVAYSGYTRAGEDGQNNTTTISLGIIPGGENNADNK